MLLWRIILDYELGQERPPTLAEIGARAGWSSKATTKGWIDMGIAKGLLRVLGQEPRTSRSVVAVRPQDLDPASVAQLRAAHWIP